MMKMAGRLLRSGLGLECHTATGRVRMNSEDAVMSAATVRRVWGESTASISSSSFALR